MKLTQVLYAVENGVATVTLNRPDAMNAFTRTMLEELVEVFRAADADDAVRVVVVTGGGKIFCAGADLESGGSTFDSKVSGDRIGVHAGRDGGGIVALEIFRCRKPVIGAINGHAVGIGITMTLPMDMRVASEDAKIGFVFTRRGITMEACSGWFLPRIVGVAKATELVYSGRVFRAKEEAASGLFNYVVPAEKVLAKAYELAREIADNTSATSVALCKGMIWHGLGEDDPQSAHLIDSKCILWAGQQKDAYEGVQSFLEKRPAKFTMSVANEMPDFYPWWKEPRVE